MQAQRACEAIKSNKRERTTPLDSVGTDKYAFHEPHVSMERVGSGRARVEIGSRSSKGREISLTDDSLEIEDQ